MIGQCFLNDEVPQAPPGQGHDANSQYILLHLVGVLWMLDWQTLMPFTPAPGGGAVDARLATLMPLTPASKRDVGGSLHRSEVYERRLYLVYIILIIPGQ